MFGSPGTRSSSARSPSSWRTRPPRPMCASAFAWRRASWRGSITRTCSTCISSARSNSALPRVRAPFAGESLDRLKKLLVAPDRVVTLGRDSARGLTGRAPGGGGPLRHQSLPTPFSARGAPRSCSTSGCAAPGAPCDAGARRDPRLRRRLLRCRRRHSPRRACLADVGNRRNAAVLMAPESFGAASRLRGAPTSTQLGALLFELLAGRPPYQGATVEGLCSNVLGGASPRSGAARPPPPPAAPGGPVALVTRCSCARSWTRARRRKRSATRLDAPR